MSFENASSPPTKQRFCVVGAGFAGLAAVRHLNKQFPNAQIVCFEKQLRVGGIWTCQPKLPNGKTSPVYKDLRTNFPLSIMAYSEYDPPVSLISQGQFVRSDYVCEYLELYATEFALHNYVKFDHRVLSIRQKNQIWNVQTECGSEVTDWLFDAVFICSGHFSAINLPPKVQPLRTTQHLFGGLILHSSEFSDGCQFSGQTVLVVGAGPSGVDLACISAKHAKKVYLCHSATRQGQLQQQTFPDNVQLVAKRFEAVLRHGTVLLEDGKEIMDLDVILLCTGYCFKFPFVHRSVALSIQYNHVQPLYKEMVHRDHPQSLFFIGLHRQVPVGRLAELQMNMAGAWIKGLVPASSLAEMKMDSENEVQRRLTLGMNKCKLHKLGHLYNYGEGQGSRSVFRDYVHDLEHMLRLNTVLGPEERIVEDWVMSELERICALPVSEVRKTD